MENEIIHRQERRKKIISLAKRTPFWLSLLAAITVIFDTGFEQTGFVQRLVFFIYIITLTVALAAIIARYFIRKERPPGKVWLFDLLLLLFVCILLFSFFKGFEITPVLLYFVIFLLFLREFSELNLNLKKRYFNPSQLFILSFIFIILCGTLLLLLPKATYSGISFIDALFTSTSAVCVTGLAVVDTGKYFTVFGQTIIAILIQTGGLGIMTFTSYFSYFFRGGSTYENQLLLKDMTNAEKIAEVFGTLKKIIVLTFSIEAVGALFIYMSLDKQLLPLVADRIFFAVFHAISGFCNAGFSTLTNSLYEAEYRFNYPLHLTLAFLFIIGGIGFPILFNFFKYLRHLVLNRLLPLSRNRKVVYIPWVINVNTRIVIITTFILIVCGTIAFYVLEYNNTLAEHSPFGKLITAFFGAVTPRTAGFNTVDNTALNFSTIMIVFLLMFIGASPGSTGGGIKTSTFAIGTLNFINLARGKDRIELFSREISDLSVKRAFAIICLSLVVIGAAVFAIASLDSEKELLTIAFECFSAYSTVGLSLGITADLNNASKMVIIFTMFIGRVSMLTILIAIFRKVKDLKYRYPTEEILIN